MVKPGQIWIRSWESKKKTPLLYKVDSVRDDLVTYSTSRNTTLRQEVRMKIWLEHLMLYKYNKSILTKRSVIA